MVAVGAVEEDGQVIVLSGAVIIAIIVMRVNTRNMETVFKSVAMRGCAIARRRSVDGIIPTLLVFTPNGSVILVPSLCQLIMTTGNFWVKLHLKGQEGLRELVVCLKVRDPPSQPRPSQPSQGWSPVIRAILPMLDSAPSFLISMQYWVR